MISDEKIQGHMTTLEEILQNPDFAPLHGIVQEVNGRVTFQSKLCSKIKNGVECKNVCEHLMHLGFCGKLTQELVHNRIFPCIMRTMQCIIHTPILGCTLKKPRKRTQITEEAVTRK